MQVKEKNRNEMIEHKKRLERHRKAIEDQIQTKATNENLTVKKKAVKKGKVDKKTQREKQQAIAEKAMDAARKKMFDEENLEEEKEEEEQKGEQKISKEERAERFKRLNMIAQEMTKKWNE